MRKATTLIVMAALALSLGMMSNPCPAFAGNCPPNGCADGELCKFGECRKACCNDGQCTAGESCYHGVCMTDGDIAGRRAAYRGKKAEKEAAEKLAAEKAAREKAEKEAAEKLAAEKAAREKAEREAAEKDEWAKRELARMETERKALERDLEIQKQFRHMEFTLAGFIAIAGIDAGQNPGGANMGFRGYWDITPWFNLLGGIGGHVQTLTDGTASGGGYLDLGIRFNAGRVVGFELLARPHFDIAHIYENGETANFAFGGEIVFQIKHFAFGLGAFHDLDTPTIGPMTLFTFSLRARPIPEGGLSKAEKKRKARRDHLRKSKRKRAEELARIQKEIAEREKVAKQLEKEIAEAGTEADVVDGENPQDNTEDDEEPNNTEETAPDP